MCLVCVPGCDKEPAVVIGSSGWVRFNEEPFETHMTCGWNIRVSENKVNNLPNIIFVSTTMGDTLFPMDSAIATKPMYTTVLYEYYKKYEFYWLT